METITSKDNDKVKYIKSLQLKKNRDQEQKYLIEGVRFVEEALAYPDSIDLVVYAPGLLVNQRGIALTEQVTKIGLPLMSVSDSILKDLSDTENPQGILAVMRRSHHNFREKLALDSGKALLLVIDGVQDPGNLGTIVRTADAAGVNGLILFKGTVDLYNPKTLRSTMGSVFRVPVWQLDDPNELTLLFRELGIKIFIAAAKANNTIYEVDFMQPAAIVFGSEAAGPSAALTALADNSIAIPMPGAAESLNVAVACGVVLFEAVRQKQINTPKIGL